MGSKVDLHRKHEREHAELLHRHSREHAEHHARHHAERAALHAKHEAELGAMQGGQQEAAPMPEGPEGNQPGGGAAMAQAPGGETPMTGA